MEANKQNCQPNDSFLLVFRLKSFAARGFRKGRDGGSGELIFQGKFNCKGGGFARQAFYRDGAVMAVDDILDNGEP